MPIKDVSAYLGFSGDFNVNDVTRLFGIHPSRYKQKGAIGSDRISPLLREHHIERVNSISVWVVSTEDKGCFLNTDDHVSVLYTLFENKVSELDKMSLSGNSASIRITLSFQNKGCVSITNDSLMKIMKISKRLDFSFFEIGFDSTRPIDATQELFKLELFAKSGKPIFSKTSSVECDSEKFLSSFISDAERKISENGKDVFDYLRITYPICGGGGLSINEVTLQRIAGLSNKLSICAIGVSDWSSDTEG